MPIITVAMGPATEEQKKKMVERFTAEAVDITGIPADHFFVMINEHPLENIGVAGRTIKEMRAGS